MHKTLTQTFISGGPGIVHCNALGNFASQFKWSRKNGRSFQDGRFIELTNVRLKVEPVRREDNSNYICIIKKSGGSESTSEKCQSNIVRVIGKMRKKIILLRRGKNINTIIGLARGCIWLMV